MFILIIIVQEQLQHQGPTSTTDINDRHQRLIDTYDNTYDDIYEDTCYKEKKTD